MINKKKIQIATILSRKEKEEKKNQVFIFLYNLFIFEMQAYTHPQKPFTHKHMQIMNKN